MAEFSVVTVADRTIRSLRCFATEEFSLFKGVTGEVARLQQALTAVQDLRGDEKVFQRNEVQSLLRRLEDALHRADYLLAEMSQEGWRRREMSAPEKVLTFFSSSNPLHVTNKKFHEIKKVRKKVEVITTQLKYKIYFSSNEKDVVWRNIDKTEIIKLILDDQPQINTNENVKVIPIVGDQGIGKTTLARIVYDDDQIRSEFELPLWVSIDGDSNNMIRVVLRLLKDAGCYLQTNGLQNELRRRIDGRKCFIVMDDMVDDDPCRWLNLLRGCAKGTCVLITTRSRKVAEITRTVHIQPYSLNRLSEEDSWHLFKRHASMDRRVQVDQELEELGRSMAARCEGVPLKLHIISSILSREVDVYKWWLLSNGNSLDELMREEGIIFADNDRETIVANAESKHAHSFLPQERVIGREDDKQAIVKLMNENSEENVMVIPIVGIEGLGKTTLAQLIFNDEKVRCHFDLKIWVCVAGTFDAKVILEKIILSVASDFQESLELDQLKKFLRREICGKRFLLILDDVPKVYQSELDELSSFLSIGANGSRIIVTSCDKDVANYTTGMTNKKHHYELKVLNEDQSYLLFLKVALVYEELFPTDPEIIEIGKEIVKKCGGVPLVLRTIGSLLFSKSPKNEWQTFYVKVLAKILSYGINSQEALPAIVQLSYDHLPSHLKYCFVYCAIFPKDYEIDVETLVSLWISQGFIESHRQQDFEELGYGYFMDLLGRSFFQETKIDELGKITKCRMQNLMHDLAREAAGNDCAIFPSDEVGKRYERLRHVSFDVHIDSFLQIPIDALNYLIPARSMILLRQSRWATEGRSSESICDVILKLKSLQVLDLHNVGIKFLPNSIGKLKRLTFLDLSQNVNMKALPNSIGQLYNLHTLKLNHCSNLQTLSRGITKLVNLRSLENESCYLLTQMPRGLSELSNLRTLTEFVLRKRTVFVSEQSSGNLAELSKLDYLRGNLKIRNLSFPAIDKTAEAKLYKKQQILSLILMWDIKKPVHEVHCEHALDDLRPHRNLRELSLSAYGGTQFSRWILSLENLVKFSLWRCTRCQYLPRLDRLPNLGVLVVDELMELEYILDDTSTNASTTTSFSSLKELRLTNLPKLMGWWKDAAENDEEESIFTCLSKLVVEDCPNLTSMPLFPCLEELLVLKNTSWKPLQKTMEAKEVTIISRASEFEASSSSSSTTTTFTFVSLSKLKTLHIIDMDMRDCDPNLWQSLPSLRSVTLDHLANIKRQLGKLRQVASLQQLHIWRCDSLVKIPSWTIYSESLKTISIKLCPMLEIPRERLSLLTTLKRVDIEDCPRVAHIETILKDPLYTQ